MRKSNPLQPLARYLTQCRDDMIQMTGQLCAIPTENPPGREFKQITDYLSEQLGHLGLETFVVVVPDDFVRLHTPPECWDFARYNIIARWDVGAAKTLHFNSHYDVVPASSDWKSDPFSPVIKNGCLYGRGTSDMKGCIVSSIYAVKALRECGLTPPWNIELSFTADEEIGGQCGVGYLIETGLIRPDAAVICEGGADDCIMAGHRGALWMDVVIQGVSAHGSNPAAGINAFEKGQALVQRFLDYHQQCQQRKSAHRMDRASARYPSLTLGGVSGGGTKLNTIPDQFHFTVDRRLIPEESVQQVQEEFLEIVRAAMRADKKLKAQTEVVMAFDAAITDNRSPICQAAKKAVGDVMGKPGKLRIFSAFTDLHFFVNAVRCPTIGYGVSGDGIHGSSEYLQIRSLVDTARVYAGIALAIQ